MWFPATILRTQQEDYPASPMPKYFEQPREQQERKDKQHGEFEQNDF